MQIDSDDYHDCVFRDGRLVGAFEEMYRKSREIPWQQDRAPDEIDVELLLALLRRRMPYTTILEVGCGLGYFGNELVPLGGKVYGIDVSPTAIEKARERFPHIQTRVCDITAPFTAGPLFPGVNEFELVVCRGLFWYVFPWMERVRRAIASWVTGGGYLVIHQNFPPLDTDFVGKDVIPTPTHLLGHFLGLGRFTLLCSNQFSDRSRGGDNEDWSTFILQRAGMGT